jgi:predicted nucleic acid-binding protein
LVEGRIATCDMVRLELLHSARDGQEFGEIADELSALPDCPLGKAEWERAIWTYARLADQSPAVHRSVKHPDLLIAAAAEASGLRLVHYDRDYEAIAQVTGQPVRWLAEPGTLR